MPTAIQKWSGGNGNYTLVVSAAVVDRDIIVTVYGRQDGRPDFYTDEAQGAAIDISGVLKEGTWKYNYRTGSNSQLILKYTRKNLPYGTHYASAYAWMDFGPEYGGKQRAYAIVRNLRVTAAPERPSPVAGTPDQITATSMRYRFTAGASNGLAILEHQVRRSTSSSFPDTITTTTTTLAAGTESLTATGLPSSTRHYFAARSRNADGWSPWSATSSATTLPAGTPGLTVIPSADGLSAALQITPPGNTSGVAEYTYEYRRDGVTATEVTSSPTPVVYNLTPGDRYEWRARVSYPSYTSPWSSWLSIRQSAPASGGNAYFDGSLGGSGRRVYSWEGSSHASRSLAKTSVPSGWHAAGRAGGTVTLARVAGGFSGGRAARAVIDSAISTGITLGQSTTAAARSLVLENVPYVGSIYVRTSKVQRVRARIAWMWGDTVGVSSYGDAQVVQPGVWTRLTVSETAPDGATGAVLRAEDDIDGTEWSAWASGDYMDADAAMLTMHRLYDYFDGSKLGDERYNYGWEGASHASVSIRTIEPERLLVISDPDCPPVPLPPTPPQIVNECVETVGTWRRFWGEIPALEVSEWMLTYPTIRLRTAGFDSRQVRIRFYRNPDGLSLEDLDPSIWEGELILSYMPSNAVVTLDGITERVTANMRNRTGVPMDHLLYGSNGGVVEWPVLTCGDPYIISWDIPVETPAGNIALELELTQRM